MKFYGIQKTTLLDFPGEVASTLFTFGCNLRCPYCHNPELIIKNEKIKPIKWNDIYSFLDKRKHLISGVCITGGEPLLNNEIIDISKQIHSLNLKVKIDTNGTIPERLKKINADYIAMDIKTSIKNYNCTVYPGHEKIEEKLLESIKWIINSGISHEFRTTIVPGIVTADDIVDIINLIKGADKYYLAQFRPQNTLDPKMENVVPYPIDVLKDMAEKVKSAGIPCEIRGVH